MPGQAAKTSKLNVALHAQSNFAKHGFVAGSEITTAGIAAALLRQPTVGKVQVFAPFVYDGLYTERCVRDLLRVHAARAVRVTEVGWPGGTW